MCMKQKYRGKYKFENLLKSKHHYFVNSYHVKFKLACIITMCFSKFNFFKFHKLSLCS